MVVLLLRLRLRGRKFVENFGGQPQSSPGGQGTSQMLVCQI